MVQNALGPGGCSGVMDERYRLATSALHTRFFLRNFMYIFVSICESSSGRLFQVQRCTISEIVAQSRWEGQEERRKD